jgi:hypothetical protein
VSRTRYLGTKHFDSENIQGLTAYILCTHVDDAFQTKPRADGRRGNAMLTGARLSDNARFSNPAGKQNLSYSIIDFMRACVIAKTARKPNDR